MKDLALNLDNFSLTQQGIYFTQAKHPNSTLYNVGGFALLKTEIKVPLLLEAIQKQLSSYDVIVNRHSYFESTAVIEKNDFDIEFINYSNKKDGETLCLEWMNSDVKDCFDIEFDLLKTRVFKINNNCFYWYVKVHHILFDGYAMQLFFNNVIKHYNTLSEESNELPTKTYLFADYVHEEVNYKISNAYKVDKLFWENKFTGFEKSLAFETCLNSKSNNNSLHATRVQIPISRNLFNQIETFCTNNKLTVTHYFIGVISLLNKGYGNGPFVLELPVFNRDNAKCKNTLGPFVKTLPFYINFLEDTSSFLNLLNTIKKELTACYRHKKYPLIDLLNSLNTRENLHNIIFSYQKNTYSETINKIQPIITFLNNGQQEEDLQFHLLEYSKTEDLVLAIDYKTEVFSEIVIKNLICHFTYLIDNQYKQDTLVHYLSPEEKHQLLVEFNDTKVDYPKDKTIVDLFEKQVKQTPNNIALVFEEKQLTYKELNEKSNQLANYIRETYEIKPDDLIGILLERSEWIIIAILGVLKSGAAYVPIDPEYPKERIDYMQEDSECKALINNNELGKFKNQQNNYSILNLKSITKANNLAYVIFTSGSTGKPKGVMIENKSVIRLIKNTNYVDLIVNKVLLSTGSLSFDATIFEYWSMLLNGGTLIICRQNVLLDNKKLGNEIRRQKVDLIWFTSAWINEIINLDIKLLKSLKVILVGGDKLSPFHLNQLKTKYKHLKIINGYGPTENATFSLTYFLRSTMIDIPIGKPINNSTAYILNNNNLQPIGVTGEICVGGDGLARGYLNRPDLTAEKFVANPFKEGELMYKTGDLGRWLPDGNIEFIGRKDDQVKIRGYRIELGEIESALNSYEQIDNSVVIAKANESGEKELVAYVTSKETLKIQELRTHLSSQLPGYMVPGYFVQLAAIPLNANGKVDRKQLPSPEGLGLASGVEYVAPRNEMEAQLVKIWEEILDKKNIGVKDNFFELGGHSLKATRLVSKIYKELNVKLELKDLFTQAKLEQQAHLIQQSQATNYINIPKVQEQPNYALSSSQRRLWVLSQFEESNVAYNMPGVFVFEGDLKIDLLERSFQSLIARHESLRTSFKEDEKGEVKQFITAIDDIDFKINYKDLSSNNQEARIVDSYIQNDFSKAFDLQKGPLLRASVYQLEKSKYIFTYVMHHIVSDGWSMDILVKEVLAFYNSYLQNTDLELKPLGIQYKDYAAWQQIQLKEESTQSHKAYWLDQFAGELPILELPTDKPRPAIKTNNGGSISKIINQTISKNLKALCQKNGSTLFMGLLASVNTLLYRYTNQEDIIIGSPIAGREHSDLEDQIGFYINTLALRSQFKGENSFEELLVHTNQITLDAYKHQLYPFDELVDELHLQRDMSRSALFDVMVVLQNTGQSKNNIYEQNLDNLKISNYQSEDIKISSKFDLEFSFAEIENSIHFNLQYNIDLYNTETINRIANHFIQLLLSITQTPTLSISQLDYLSLEEKHQLLVSFNDTKAEYPKDKTIVDLFEKQVKQTPNNIALVFEEKELTYKELNEKANQLANYIRETYEIKPDDLIGILLERSEWMVIAILGILKSGAAYVPIDPEYPQDRIDYMLEDSQCKVLINKNELEEFKLVEKKFKKGNIKSINNSNNLVYVIYTSGSTGNPKGVMVEHGNAVGRLITETKLLDINKDVITCLTTNYVFDVSLLEIFLPIINGGVIIYPNKQQISYAENLVNLLILKRVNLLQGTPIFFRSFLLSTGEKQIKKLGQFLRKICVGGESLLPEMIDEIYKNYPNVTLNNHYGPTETTIDSIVLKNVTKLHVNNIGSPISNTQIYILNNNTLQPIGVTGEICVGGDGLARGYLNRPDLTAEKFVANPFKEGELMYKTGDLGRWLPDGNIEFIGRKDDQVKIRGYRIELGEIESALNSYEQIDNSVVIAKANESGEKELVAYVTSKETLKIQELRTHLSSQLPGYMVPGYFVQLAAIPLNANGKVDRKQLPSPEGLGLASGVEYVAPRNEMEAQLVKIWEEILDKKNIGVKDNFFELGGHSLKATRLVSKIYKELNVKLELKDLFTQAKLEQQAHLIQQSQATNYINIPKVQEQPNYALSSSQRRLWVLSQFEESNVAYNMPGVFVFEGDLKIDLLERSFQSLIARHESLRTSFKEDEKGEVKQFITAIDDIDFKINYKDLSSNNQEARIVDSYIQNDFSKAFDLQKGPLLRASVYQLEKSKYIFTYVMHHIVSDGWSMDILVKEVLAFYNSYLQNTDLELKPLGIQYKDYAAWQQIQLKEESTQSHKAYWLDQFAGELPILELPTDKPRPAIKTNNGGSISKIINQTISKNLKALCQKNGSTLFMGLLASVNTLLYRYTNQEDIIIGSPIAGREHSDLEDQIGFYINTLALRSQFKGENSFEELLVHTNQITLDAYKHQLYPFDELVDELHLQRDMSRSALFDVMVVLQNTGQSKNNIYEQNLDNLKISNYQSEDIKISSKFDLEFSFAEIENSIHFNLQYNIDLYNTETINRIANHFIQLLLSITQTPTLSISQLDYLSLEEKHQLLVSFNDTKAEYPKDKTIVDLFEKQVKQTPNNIALVFEEKELTYKELNEKANQLAHYLRQTYNIQPDDLIGILLERSEWMIVAILGVLKSGAAYVPIDPEYPQERIDYMVEDSQCKALINNNELQKFKLIEKKFKKGNIKSINNSNNLVYVIYTSGSTGNPKGVMVEHKNLIARIIYLKEVYSINQKDNLLFYRSYSFDAAIEEYLLPLMVGAKCFIAPADFKQDLINNIFNYVERNGITKINMPPVLLGELVQSVDNKNSKRLASLKHIISGGDKLTEKMILDYFSKFNANFYNAYGPTENTNDSVNWKVDVMSIHDGRIPIGKPINNSTAYILNNNNLQPIGVIGEICVGGDGLARGYLNRPDLTAEKFIANPFKEGERIYKTGDLGRWLPDGNIEFIGRKDDQVKIRGYRIELGEIESALNSYELINNSVVIAKANDSGEKELVAYVTSKETLKIQDLRTHLSSQLPGYMVPGYFVQLDAIPLNANGKVDRKQLPNPDGSGLSSGVEYVAPRNETEVKLVKIWEEILDKKNIGVKDNFFELGGHSLKATRLLSIINRDFDVKTDLKFFFMYPTIENLSRSIIDNLSTENDKESHFKSEITI